VIFAVPVVIAVVSSLVATQMTSCSTILVPEICPVVGVPKAIAPAESSQNRNRSAFGSTSEAPVPPSARTTSVPLGA
jgi:hypothetical protein